MKTNTSRKMIWTKSLVLLPLLAVLVYSFSSREILTQANPSNTQKSPEEKVGLQSEDLVIAETINVYIPGTGPLVVNGQAIAMEELSDRLAQINTHLTKETRKEIVRAVITAEEKIPMKIVSEVRGYLFEYGVHYVQLEKVENMKASPEHEKAIKEELEKINHLKIQYTQLQQEQEKATPEMVAEYNKWAKHYNENANAFMEIEIWERMNYIYKIMTPEQKKNSEKFPSVNQNYIITIVEDEANGKNETIKNRTEEVPPPPQPPAPPIIKDGDVPMPPPPPPPAPTVEQAADMPAPPPPTPVEAIEDWIEEGATFFLNGKKVTGQQALQVVRENNEKNLSVQVEENVSGKIVRLSDNKK